MQRNGTNVTAALASNRLPSSMEEREEIINLNLHEIMFWKFVDNTNSLLLSAYMDKKLCFHITTAFSNNIIDKEPSKRSQRRKKRFEKFQSLTQELQTDQDGLMTFPANFDDMMMIEDDLEAKGDNTENLVPALEETETKIPEMIRAYSASAKGVDFLNQTCAYYSYPHRNLKWYRAIVHWLLEITLNNSYKLYCEVLKERAMSMLKYRKFIIEAWEADHLEPVEEEHTEMEEEKETDQITTSSDMEEGCRLRALYPMNYCDMCSEGRTAYVCANRGCMIRKRPYDPLRQLRVHPECAHLHFKNS